MSLLERIEIETAAKPSHAVIWLHGLGADGHDFEPIVPQLVAPDWPAIRFVFPHAPVRPVTINGGMRMRAWYDILAMDIDRGQDREGIDASVAQVRELIAHEQSRGIERSRIVLAGFSQGAAITLTTGLQQTDPLAGLIALSGYLPGVNSLPAHPGPTRAVQQPVFLAHGRVDPVVPFALGEMTRAHLDRIGFKVDFHAYPIAHGVSNEEISDLRTWLSRLWAAEA